MNLLEQRDRIVEEYLKVNVTGEDFNALPDIWRIAIQNIVRKSFEDGFKFGVKAMEQSNS